MNLLGRDVWLKHTDKEGKSFTQHHRVWDIGIFMESEKAAAAKVGGKVEQVLEPKRVPRNL